MGNEARGEAHRCLAPAPEARPTSLQTLVSMLAAGTDEFRYSKWKDEVDDVPPAQLSSWAPQPGEEGAMSACVRVAEQPTPRDNIGLGSHFKQSFNRVNAHGADLELHLKKRSAGSTIASGSRGGGSGSGKSASGFVPGRVTS